MRRVHDLSAISSRSWLMIQRHAEAALAHAGGTHDWDDVLSLLVADKLQLWIGRDSVMMTELVEYPKLSACRIFLAGGKLEEIVDMVAALETEAAAIGCSRLEQAGGRDWGAVAKRHGWQVRSYCTKEIGNGQH